MFTANLAHYELCIVNDMHVQKCKTHLHDYLLPLKTYFSCNHTVGLLQTMHNIEQHTKNPSFRLSQNYVLLSPEIWKIFLLF